MPNFAFILIILVALEFFFIMYLETFATVSKLTAKTFNMTQHELQNRNVQTLFKNQGVYNGLIGIGLLYSAFILHSQPTVIMLLVYIIAVAFYGAMTSQKMILIKQGGLPIITLLVILI